MAMNAKYLILFFILVPQMRIKKLPHMRIKKFTTEQKNVAPEFFFCTFFTKIYWNCETIYNLCSFHGRWGSRKKKTLQFIFV